MRFYILLVFMVNCFGEQHMKKHVYSIQEISKLVEPVARSYGAEQLYVFGSYARGDATQENDIDFRLWVPFSAIISSRFTSH